MTTHQNPEEEALHTQDSHSTPSPESTETQAKSATPIPGTRTEKASGPTLVHAKPHGSSKTPKVKNKTPKAKKAPKDRPSLLGFSLFTSGLSLGALGCGLVLARGPFGDLASRLEPLAQRGLTGGSMILTGMVLTAMALVERQLRKQSKALETQDANAAMLQDIFGSMATIQNRFDELQNSDRVIYAEANMMRNELHHFVTAQDGKDEQTGIFHVAASVDKLSAQVDRTLKGFGTDLQEKLRVAQEQARATHEQLEGKLQGMVSPEFPDNSEVLAAQSDLAQRLESLETHLCESRSEWSQVGDQIQSKVCEALEESFKGMKSEGDVSFMASQSEICERLMTLEENLLQSQARVDRIGDQVQSAILESLQNLPDREVHDDSALLASQTEIVDRLKDLENHLANTRSRFGEVEEALQSSLRDALNNRDHHSVDARIEDLRAELTHVSETVEAAVKCALESAPSLRPATREGSEPTPFALESSETSSSQTWPLQGPSKSQGVEVHPPLEILHMPTDEEMKSAVSQKPDQMTHALNHLFQPITPEEDKRTDRNDGMFLDQYPKSNGAQENRDAEGSTGPMLFMSPGSHPLPGTPGSPFPNPVPLKPTDSDSDSDSDDSKEEPNEGSSYFQKPYEPPSDHKGFRFPGWNK